MEKITVENFNESLGKNLLDRLVQADATRYSVLYSKGLESVEYKKCVSYKNAVWDIFRDEIYEKLTEEELMIFFNYENNRYETFSKKEDSNSKYVAKSSYDMLCHFAYTLKPHHFSVYNAVEELAAKSK